MKYFKLTIDDKNDQPIKGVVLWNDEGNPNGWWQEATAFDYYLQEGKLPGEYVVECKNIEEAQEVFEYHYGYNPIIFFYKYVTLSKYILNKPIGQKGDGFSDEIREKYKDFPLFTYEQWKQLKELNNKEDMKEEFVLPSEWCVKVRNSQEDKVLCKWRNGGRTDEIGVSYMLSSKMWSSRKIGVEITYDQFVKYVLKQNNMKEKEIIGYKLKEDCEKYREAAKIIKMDFNGIPSEYLDGNITMWTGIKDSFLKDAMTKAGVWELWFEPVYKESAPNITINGYKGEFFDTYVKFGCAEINKQCFIDLYAFHNRYYKDQNKGIESVTIGKGTFTKDQIKEIAKYYQNKKE